MPNVQRTLQHLLLVTAATLSLGAISTPAAAGVDVQIGFVVPGIVVDARDPYYYSPEYCAGCWYGQWGGRQATTGAAGVPGSASTTKGTITDTATGTRCGTKGTAKSGGGLLAGATP